MNIAVCSNNLFQGDAVGDYIVWISRQLRKRGHKVAIFLQDSCKDPPKDLADVIKDSLATHWTYTGLAPVDRIISLSQLRGYDAIWLQYPMYSIFADMFAKIRTAMKIFDFHCVTPPDLMGQDPIFVKSVSKVRPTARRANYLIAHSDYAARSLTKETERNDVHRLCYAVQTDRFSCRKKDQEILDEYDLGDSIVLLYVGRMARNKRIDILIRALKLIRDKTGEKVKLLLVGDYLNYYDVYLEARQLARSLDMSEDVVFAGRTHTLLHKFYSVADAYVCASLHECFCIPLVEAMAAGVPIVAANSTAIPETLGSAGLLFEPGDYSELADKTISILANNGLRNRLIRLGRVRAPLFSQDRLRDEFDSFLSHLMRDSHGN
jgi:glycosyltransferase involved in cell wall biosynthesis